MSFQAVTWAIQQKTGGTSGKAALLSIANYAGETWCSWPSQTTVADESEQSVDSVQRRFKELADGGILRRIPMKHGGRKTVDFLILAPSPFFKAPLEEIERILPRGCEIDRRAVAADCGSDTEDTPAESQGDSDAGALPQTLPQPAGAVTAMVRQQESSTEPLNRSERDARTREGQEAEPGLPDHDLLAKLIAAHPQSAHDSVADTHAAWRKLTRPERREAVDRFEEWLHVKGARKAIAGLPMYLGEKRWTMLGDKASVIAAAATPRIDAFSRPWWWLFHDFIARHGIEAGRRDSPAHQELYRRVSGAVSYGAGWPIAAEQREEIEQAARALHQVPKEGTEAQQWRSYYGDLGPKETPLYRRGITMPIPDKAEWIFVPAEIPRQPEDLTAVAEQALSR